MKKRLSNSRVKLMNPWMRHHSMNKRSSINKNLLKSKMKKNNNKRMMKDKRKDLSSMR
jgi:hypothetical protein